MKSLVLVVCILTSIPASVFADTFSDYLSTAERRGKGLVTTYFGAGSYVKSFKQVPGGAFKLDAVSKEGESLSLFMLGDFETLIYGQMITPHIADKAQAGGLPVLEQIAERNKKRISLRKKTTEFVAKYSAGTAAALLNDDNFEKDTTEPPAAHLATPQSQSEEESDNVILDKVRGLQHVQLGEGNRELFLFMDLNCPACQQELPHLIEMAKSRSVSIKVIPVAFVKPQDSTDKAIHLLSETNSKARIDRLKLLAQRKSFSQLVSDNKSVVNIKAAQSLQQNNKVFNSLPNIATPYFVANTNYGLITRALVSKAKVEQLIDAITPIAAQTMQSDGQAVSTNADDI